MKRQTGRTSLMRREAARVWGPTSSQAHWLRRVLTPEVAWEVERLGRPSGSWMREALGTLASRQAPWQLAPGTADTGTTQPSLKLRSGDDAVQCCAVLCDAQLVRQYVHGNCTNA
jgi:hypothetical protein